MQKKCPLLDGECIEHACKFWIHLVGSNPQTGAQMDSFDCAVAWIPILMVETANETRKTAASVQSFRNEMVKQNQVLIGMVPAERIEHNGDAA